MNKMKSEILDRLITAQRTIGGMLKFSGTTPSFPYLLRQVGKQGLMVAWGNDRYEVQYIGNPHVDHFDTVASLNDAVNRHFDKEIEAANDVGHHNN